MLSFLRGERQRCFFCQPRLSPCQWLYHVGDCCWQLLCVCVCCGKCNCNYVWFYFTIMIDIDPIAYDVLGISPFVSMIGKHTTCQNIVQAPAAVAGRKNIRVDPTAPCIGDFEEGSGADSSAKFSRADTAAGACTVIRLSSLLKQLPDHFQLVTKLCNLSGLRCIFGL